MSGITEYPILQTKGLRLQKIDVIDGHLIITLQSPTTSDVKGAIVIDVLMDMARVTFRYAIVDKDTATVRTYQGRTGNPLLDPYIIEGV